MAHVTPISGPKRSEDRRRPCICHELFSEIFERDMSCWGKIIDDCNIAQIIINITPVIAFSPPLNLRNEFN